MSKNQIDQYLFKVLYSCKTQDQIDSFERWALPILSRRYEKDSWQSFYSRIDLTILLSEHKPWFKRLNGP